MNCDGNFTSNEVFGHVALVWRRQIGRGRETEEKLLIPPQHSSMQQASKPASSYLLKWLTKTDTDLILTTKNCVVKLVSISECLLQWQKLSWKIMVRCKRSWSLSFSDSWHAMLSYSYMALWHDDKMDGYRAPCLDNAYHLMATW